MSGSNLTFILLLISQSNDFHIFLPFQMNELLVSKAQAEKVLREQSGDVVAALEAIISN